MTRGLSFKGYTFLGPTLSLLNHTFQDTAYKGIWKTRPKWCRRSTRFRSPNMLPVHFSRLISHSPNQRTSITSASYQVLEKQRWRQFDPSSGETGKINAQTRLLTTPQPWCKCSHFYLTTSLFKTVWAPQPPIITHPNKPIQMPSLPPLSLHTCLVISSNWFPLVLK